MDVALQYDNQMKATEQYFPVMLSNLSDKVVQSFESVDEILKCHSPFKIRLKWNCLLTMLNYALLSLKYVSCLLSPFL